MGAARVGCEVVIPYREEMTKRHLKVTGDLGRVAFIVCLRGSQIARPVIDPAIRNTICATLSRSRRLSDIQMSSTTWLADNTRQSMFEGKAGGKS